MLLVSAAGSHHLKSNSPVCVNLKQEMARNNMAIERIT